MQRQRRTIEAGNLRSREKRRCRRLLRAVGQSQFRRPSAPGNKNEFPGLAALGGRLCAGRKLGQMSLRYTGFPSVPCPSGSVVISMSKLPASAQAPTKGGEAREVIFIFRCTRPSKLRLPDSTEQATTSALFTASEISGLNGPELPMQVVQP